MRVQADAKIVSGRLQVHFDLKEGWVTTQDGNRLYLDGSGELRVSPDGPSVYGEGGGSGDRSDKEIYGEVDHSPVVSTKEIGKDWEGRRGSIALSAIEKINRGTASGVTIRQGNELVAVASYGNVTRKYAEVSYIATKKPGLGAALMAEICEVVSRGGRGVVLEGFVDAKGFYEKIGMRKDGKEGRTGNQAYIFSAKEAKAFAEKYKQEHKSINEWDGLVMLEPESGVFAVSVEGD